MPDVDKTTAPPPGAAQVQELPMEQDLQESYLPGGTGPAEWEWLSRLHLTRT